MNKKFTWTKKDLLGLEYLSADEINCILDTAQTFKTKTGDITKGSALRTKTTANLFYEPSTRTRASFEIAEKNLGSEVINMDMKASSITKGETLIDTGKNLEALKIDIFVIRHSSAGAPNILARNVKASIINAGDGFHEHPTQALLDLFTMREKLKRIKGKNVSIIGDIAHSRVARSNIWGLKKLGANVTICAPKIILPKFAKEFGVKVTDKIDVALKNADAINVLRMQFERDVATAFPSKEEYFNQYGISEEKLKKAKRNVVVMHPGPINRGIEMSSEVADGKNSVILQQVTNGIAIRMAVLKLCAGVKQ